MDEHLRTRLAELSRVSSPPLREAIDDVLAGRSSLRALARTPEFTDAVSRPVTQAVAAMDRQSREERERAEADGLARFGDSFQ